MKPNHKYRDAAKVERTIKSCETSDQIIVACRMASNFYKIHKDLNLYILLSSLGTSFIESLFTQPP